MVFKIITYMHNCLTRLVLIIICSVIVITFCKAQTIKINNYTTESTNLIAKTQIVNTEVELAEAIAKNTQQLMANGYLAVSLDSVIQTDTTAKLYYYLGKKYTWAKLNYSINDAALLANLGFNKTRFTNTQVQPKQIAALAEKIISYYENNGYPFASVKLDSISQNENGGIAANLLINKNTFIAIDSIDIQGDAQIGYSFISKHLGIAQGDIYNEQILKSISNKLKELPYLQEERPWRMSFGITKSILTLYLKTKNANSADIILGLLPNNSSVGGRFLLTGDVKLALVNAFNAGEKVVLNWQNLQYKSPRLLLETSLPYFLGSVLGVGGKFNYVKNDTSFSTVLGELSVQYLLKGSQSFKAYYQYNSANLITVDTNSVKLTRKLPSALDFSNNAFGMAYTLDKTDFILNPHKGVQLSVNGNIAIRNIIKNTFIENLYDASTGGNFNYLYNTLALRSNRFTLLPSANFYIPVSKVITTKLAYNGGIMFNPTLFKNEVFQIGGFRLLRGYDEASIFTNNYHVATLEPRYKLNTLSYLFAFVDVAAIKSPFIDNSQQKYGWGSGAGIVLEVRNGLFNILYAVGNGLGTGAKFNNSKIHFGYSNRF
jgi:outer membrane protein assembly factor BamA